MKTELVHILLSTLLNILGVPMEGGKREWTVLAAKQLVIRYMRRCRDTRSWRFAPSLARPASRE
jgi:hypothetical protein